MQITEVRIFPTHEDLVRAYVTIVFDNCLMIREIRVIKSTTGLFVSFPARKQRGGAHWDIAYPANAEARSMIQRVILAEYEKVIAGSDSVPSASAK
jgi:stage V sporulation protein G